MLGVVLVEPSPAFVFGVVQLASSGPPRPVAWRYWSPMLPRFLAGDFAGEALRLKNKIADGLRISVPVKTRADYLKVRMRN